MVEPELVSRVSASTGLSPQESARVVADVVAYYCETTEAFVRRRHQHLQARGRKNAEIFSQLSSELARRVVAAPPLSERQLRRIVYG